MQAMQLQLFLYQRLCGSPPLVPEVVSGALPPCRDVVTCGGCQEEFQLEDLLNFLTHKTYCSKSQFSSSSPPRSFGDAQTSTGGESLQEINNLMWIQYRKRLESDDPYVQSASRGFHWHRY